MNSSAAFKKFLLLAGDAIALTGALLLAMAIRYPRSKAWDAELLRNHFVPFGILFLLWLTIFYIYNLYDLRHGENTVTFFAIASQAFLLNALAAIAFFYLNPYVSITPRTVLFIDLVFSALLFGAWRALFNRTLATKLITHVALMGVSRQMVALARELEAYPGLGYRTTCFVADELAGIPENLAHIPAITSSALQRLGSGTEQPSFPRIDTIVLDKNPNQAPERALALFALIGTKVSFLTLPAFIEQAFQKIPLSEISESWFLENLRESEKKLGERVKRLLDIAGALVVGVLLLPVMVLVALGIKLEDGRRVLYRQTRVGKNGRIFALVKFQSMVENAEKGGPQWTTHNDSRVTRFGSLLRSTRLDELPQLWNVLKGDISFMGPRPERPEFVQKLEHDIPFYNIRHLVRPGLSGWAQINNPFHSVEESYEKLEYDLFYIKNRSFALDAAIALKTLSIILMRKGR